MIEWDDNGIEFLYPDALVSSIYRRQGVKAESLTINGDFVSYGDISYKKMELCKLVTDGITETTALPVELTNKLIEPLRNLMR